MSVAGTPITPGQAATLGHFDPGRAVNVSPSLVDGDNTMVVDFANQRYQGHFSTLPRPSVLRALLTDLIQS